MTELSTKLTEAGLDKPNVRNIVNSIGHIIVVGVGEPYYKMRLACNIAMPNQGGKLLGYEIETNVRNVIVEHVARKLFP